MRASNATRDHWPFWCRRCIAVWRTSSASPWRSPSRWGSCCVRAGPGRPDEGSASAGAPSPRGGSGPVTEKKQDLKNKHERHSAPWEVQRQAMKPPFPCLCRTSCCARWSRWTKRAAAAPSPPHCARICGWGWTASPTAARWTAGKPRRWYSARSRTRSGRRFPAKPVDGCAGALWLVYIEGVPLNCKGQSTLKSCQE